MDDRRNSPELYTRNEVLSVSREFGVVNQIEFQGRSFAGKSLENYKIVSKDQIVYIKSPLRSNPYGIIQSTRDKEGILSPLYGVYNPITGYGDASFAEQYFALDTRLNNYLYPLVNKGAKNTLLISDEQALNGDVFFPKDVKEQHAIGSFLDYLDTLITLHQEEQ